jgi:hypothetical protein
MVLRDNRGGPVSTQLLSMNAHLIGRMHGRGE